MIALRWEEGGGALNQEGSGGWYEGCLDSKYISKVEPTRSPDGPVVGVRNKGRKACLTFPRATKILRSLVTKISRRRRFGCHNQGCRRVSLEFVRHQVGMWARHEKRSLVDKNTECYLKASNRGIVINKVNRAEACMVDKPRQLLIGKFSLL